MDNRFVVHVEKNSFQFAEKLMLLILERLDASALISYAANDPDNFLVLSKESTWEDMVHINPDFQNLISEICDPNSIAYKYGFIFRQLPAKICVNDFSVLPISFKLNPFSTEKN